MANEPGKLGRKAQHIYLVNSKQVAWKITKILKLICVILIGFVLCDNINSLPGLKHNLLVTINLLIALELARLGKMCEIVVKDLFHLENILITEKIFSSDKFGHFEQ